ncbi:hypothetical protein GF312_12545 [Candidatus Poribacteria bacterium]|nr:hypothetical protein [Candidatus Poribacteria bacterium]
MRIIFTAALITIMFVSSNVNAETINTPESMRINVEKLREQVIQESLIKLVTSCESATASLFITQDPIMYQRDVFDATYQITNVVARRRPKTTDDMRWFEQRLPFCPFRLNSDVIEVVDYKASGLGFVVIEGRIYKHGVNPAENSIISGKMLKFQI